MRGPRARPPKPSFEFAVRCIRLAEPRLTRPYKSILWWVCCWLAWEGPGWDDLALGLASRAGHLSHPELAELAFLSLASVADDATVRRRLAAVLSVLRDPATAPRTRAPEVAE